MIREMKSRGFDVKGEPEFADATLEVRDLLATLQESCEAPFEAPPDTTVPADQETAPELPPQRWFEEDVRGLRGLGLNPPAQRASPWQRKPPSNQGK